MTTVTATKTKRPNAKEMAKEMSLLKSLLIGLVGKDEEGAYRPDFVRRILHTAHQPAVGVFTTSEDFLRVLKKYAS